MKILNVFNTLMLKQILFHTKTFLKEYSTIFQLKVLQLKVQHFHRKVPSQKPMLRQI